MNTRKMLIGCGVALLVGLLLVAVGLVVSTLLPKKGQPATTGPAILVNINLPLNGAKLPLNEPVSVYAEAVGGSTVHDLELWVDGAFSPTKMDSSPPDRSPLNAVWLWKPAEEGVHRLIVRALGPGGEAVNSNVVRVSVLPRDQIAALHVATLAADQLPPSIAAPEVGAAGAPEGSGGGVPEPPPLPPEPPPQPQDPAPGPVGTPGLQGTVNGCDVNLLIQDNSDDEDGFYLYRFDPTSTGFTRVATLDKHAGTGAFPYLDPGLGLGNHTYYITSFVGVAETGSTLINLEITEPQCAAASPQAFGLQDAILTTTKAVDKIYCYLSVNGGPWSRIPPGSNTFIFPSPAGFDLGDYLNNLISPPPPGGVTLELECWGWSGGTLVYLGYLKQEVGAGPVELIAQDFSLIGQGLEIVGPETSPSNPSPQIAAPYNVNFAADFDDCIAHTGGVFTEQVAADICNSTKIGFTILTWHWLPGCWFPKPGETCPYTVEDIEGYHIYRQTPGNDPVQVTYVVVPKLHVAMISPGSSAGLMIQPEYFVRAYKGSQESQDSAHIAGVQPKYTVTLTNPYLWEGAVLGEKYEGHLLCPDGFGPNYGEAATDPPVLVGYSYTAADSSMPGCTQYWSTFRDGHIVFDLSSIHGQVTGAVLRWQVKGNSAAGGGVKGYVSYGCWIPLVDQNSAIIANYPLSGGYDVTTQVRAWVQGLPNKGFALLSGDRTLAWAAGERCQETFGDFELDATYTSP